MLLGATNLLCVLTVKGKYTTTTLSTWRMKTDFFTDSAIEMTLENVTVLAANVYVLPPKGDRPPTYATCP